ncbi:short chain dehydrogenase [Mycobacterium tuberculosis EAI5/NITR206]|nr:short chain dehydrogenase [Mycobacterium tuberculosis EAI5/NITR206]
MTSLAERTVLVTGANRGMGREYVAQLLGRKVAKVYAATRNPLAIDVSDPRVIPLQLDVTDAVSVAEAADLATDVGILINNAGISRASSVLDKDTSALRGELETNLFGPLALASAFADRIAERSGAIVNVSSVLAWLPLGMSYGVSKAAMWSATESMRFELGRAVCRWWASTWGWSTPTWVDSPTRRSPILPMWSARCSTE